MSLLIYIIVLFFIGLYLSSLYYCAWLFPLISKYVYLSLYSIRIAPLQGNHGYFFYLVINKNKKQDKMKLENITIVFYSITYNHPFFHYTTSLLVLKYFP